METYPLPGHPCGCGLAGGGAEGERCDFHGFEVIMDGLTDKWTDRISTCRLDPCKGSSKKINLKFEGHGLKHSRPERAPL